MCHNLLVLLSSPFSNSKMNTTAVPTGNNKQQASVLGAPSCDGMFCASILSLVWFLFGLWGWCWCFLQYTKDLVAKCLIRSRLHQRVNFFVCFGLIKIYGEKKSAASLLPTLRVWETALCSAPSRVTFIRAEWACSSFCISSFPHSPGRGANMGDVRQQSMCTCVSELALVRTAVCALLGGDGLLIAMGRDFMRVGESVLQHAAALHKAIRCFFAGIMSWVSSQKAAQRSPEPAQGEQWECIARRGKTKTQPPYPGSRSSWITLS